MSQSAGYYKASQAQQVGVHNWDNNLKGLKFVSLHNGTVQVLLLHRLVHAFDFSRMALKAHFSHFHFVILRHICSLYLLNVVAGIWKWGIFAIMLIVVNIALGFESFLFISFQVCLHFITLISVDLFLIQWLFFFFFGQVLFCALFTVWIL